VVVVVNYKHEYILTLLLWCFYVSSAHAVEVKKSKSGICHDQNSAYFIKTKNFTSFSTLVSCLDSGGRLPKKSRRKSSNDVKVQDKKVLSTNISTSLNYSRSQFGNGWADIDNDCQNSRMETLISQSVGQVQFDSTRPCKVLYGKWISPFTGRTIYSASEIDIDHVVPLYWAWHRGANKWSKERRVEFANAPANLLSVEARLNRQKGAKGLDKWLPPTNQCQYISRFLRVSKIYELKLSSMEESRYSEVKQRYCS
jgi:hypothetical protein